MTRFKICGLTTGKDVKLAAGYRAWACGFVLSESPRRVSVARVAELTPLCGDSLAVAVVTTEEPQWIAGAVAAGGFGAVQLSAGAGGASVAAAGRGSAPPQTRRTPTRPTWSCSTRARRMPPARLEGARG